MTPDSLSTTPTQAATHLVSIRFGASWKKSPLVSDLGGALKGCRVVGVVVCKLDESLDPDRTPRDGILLRHVQSKKYRLCGPFGVHELDTDRTDRFLQDLRQGHHGGPGRCQGQLTIDGHSYTRPSEIRLPGTTISWVTRFGSGEFSRGLRRIGSVVVERMEEASALPLVLDGKASDRMSLRRCKAYLDAESARRFRAFGAGNLSEGIRRACQFVRSAN